MFERLSSVVRDHLRWKRFIFGDIVSISLLFMFWSPSSQGRNPFQDHDSPVVDSDNTTSFETGNEPRLGSEAPQPTSSNERGAQETRTAPLPPHGNSVLPVNSPVVQPRPGLTSVSDFIARYEPSTGVFQAALDRAANLSEARNNPTTLQNFAANPVYWATHGRGHAIDIANHAVGLHNQLRTSGFYNQLPHVGSMSQSVRTELSRSIPELGALYGLTHDMGMYGTTLAHRDRHFLVAPMMAFGYVPHEMRNEARGFHDMLERLGNDPNSAIMREINQLLESGAYPGVSEADVRQGRANALNAKRRLLAEVVFGSVSHGRIAGEFANLGFNLETAEGRATVAARRDFYLRALRDASPEGSHVRMLEHDLAQARTRSGSTREVIAGLEARLVETRREASAVHQNERVNLNSFYGGAENVNRLFMLWNDPQYIATLPSSQREALTRFGSFVAEGERLLSAADGNRQRGPLLVGAGNTQIVNTPSGTMMVVTDHTNGRRVYASIQSEFQTGEANLLRGMVDPQGRWVMPVVSGRFTAEEIPRQANAAAMIAVDTFKNMARAIPSLGSQPLRLVVTGENPVFYQVLNTALESHFTSINAERARQGRPGFTFELVTPEAALAGAASATRPRIVHVPGIQGGPPIGNITSNPESGRLQSGRVLTGPERTALATGIEGMGFGRQSWLLNQVLTPEARHVTVPSGNILISAGSPPGAVYFLTSGTVEIAHAGAGAQPIRLTATPGNPIPIGENSALSRQGRDATVRVISNAEVIMIPSHVAQGWTVNDLVIPNNEIPAYVERMYSRRGTNPSPSSNSPPVAGSAQREPSPLTTAELAGVQPGSRAPEQMVRTRHAYQTLGIGQVTPVTETVRNTVGATNETAYRATRLLDALGMNHDSHFRRTLEGNGVLEFSINESSATNNARQTARNIVEAHRYLSQLMILDPVRYGGLKLPDIRIEGTGENARLIVSMSQQGATPVEQMANRGQLIVSLLELAPNYLNEANQGRNARMSPEAARAVQTIVQNQTRLNAQNTFFNAVVAEMNRSGGLPTDAMTRLPESAIASAANAEANRLSQLIEGRARTLPALKEEIRRLMAVATDAELTRLEALERTGSQRAIESELRNQIARNRDLYQKLRPEHTFMQNALEAQAAQNERARLGGLTTPEAMRNELVAQATRATGPEQRRLNDLASARTPNQQVQAEIQSQILRETNLMTNRLNEMNNIRAQTIRENGIGMQRELARQQQQYQQGLDTHFRNSNAGAVMNLIGLVHGIRALTQPHVESSNTPPWERNFRAIAPFAQIGFATSGLTTDVLLRNTPNPFAVGSSRLVRLGGHLSAATGTATMGLSAITEGIALNNALFHDENRDGFRGSRIANSAFLSTANTIGALGQATAWIAPAGSATGRIGGLIAGSIVLPVLVAYEAGRTIVAANEMMQAQADFTIGFNDMVQSINRPTSVIGTPGIFSSYVDIPGLRPVASDYRHLRNWISVVSTDPRRMRNRDRTPMNWEDLLHNNPENFVNNSRIFADWNRNRVRNLESSPLLSGFRNSLNSTPLGQATMWLTQPSHNNFETQRDAMLQELNNRRELVTLGSHAQNEMWGNSENGWRSFMARDADYLRLIRPLEAQWAPQVAEFNRLRQIRQGMRPGQQRDQLIQLGMSHDTNDPLRRQFDAANVEAAAEDQRRLQLATSLAQRYMNASGRNRGAVLDEIRELLGISRDDWDWSNSNAANSNLPLVNTVTAQANRGQEAFTEFLRRQIIARSAHQTVMLHFAGRLSVIREREIMEPLLANERRVVEQHNTMQSAVEAYYQSIINARSGGQTDQSAAAVNAALTRVNEQFRILQDRAYAESPLPISQTARANNEAALITALTADRRAIEEGHSVEFRGRERVRNYLRDHYTSEAERHFLRNIDFVRRVEIEDLPERHLLALSMSRERYIERNMEFAPEQMVAQSRRETTQYAANLIGVNREREQLPTAPAVNGAIEQMNSAEIGNAPVLDNNNRPQIVNQRPVTLANHLSELTTIIASQEADVSLMRTRMQRTGTDPAVRADLEARITIKETVIAQMRVSRALVENQNMAWRTQRLQEIQRLYRTETARLFDAAIAVTNGGAPQMNNTVRAEITRLRENAILSQSVVTQLRGQTTRSPSPDTLLEAETRAMVATRALAERLYAITRPPLLIPAPTRSIQSSNPVSSTQSQTGNSTLLAPAPTRSIQSSNPVSSTTTTIPVPYQNNNPYLPQR